MPHQKKGGAHFANPESNQTFSRATMTHTHPTAAGTQFWYTRSPVPTPLGIAVHLGWLNGEPSADGIAIKSMHSFSVRNDLRAYDMHTLAHTFRQGSSIPALWARASGANTKVIGLTWTDESQQILALPHTGIKSIKALRGRRLAIPFAADDQIDMFRATAMRGFISALELEGLDSKDVEFILIPRDVRGSYLAEIQALLDNKVDAIYVRGAPGLEIAQTLNTTLVADIGFHPDPHVRNNNGTPRPLTVDADILHHFPDIVTGFLQLVCDAGKWATTHPDETIAYIAKETNTTAKNVQAAYGKDLHRHLQVDLSQTSIAALAEFKQFLYQNTLIPDDFSITDWIDPAPLQQVLHHRA